MICREFLALLDAAGVALAPEALAHAESCPACGRTWERWHMARRALRALGDEPPPAFLAERVMARVRAERRDAPQPAYVSWRLRSALAAASAVVVALGGYVLWSALRTAGTPVQEARSGAVLADSRNRTAAAPAEPPALAAAPAPAPAEVPTAPPATQPRPARRDKGARPVMTAQAPAREAAVARSTSRDEAIETEAAAIVPPAEPGAVGGIVFPAGMAREADTADAQASEKRADAAGAGSALAKLEAARPRGPALVELVLVGQRDGSRSVLRAPAVAAPPSGEHWIVRVAPDRTITLLDAAGRDIGAAHADAIATVRAADPAPGGYLLTRR